MTILNEEKHVKLSRFISFILRHKPESIGLTIDRNGYVNVNELISKVNTTKYNLNREILDEIVTSDKKERYSYDNTGINIRANQGHSLDVDLKLTEAIPPKVLYHGTSISNLKSIETDGILKQSRHHVHLSADITTAIDVGSRRSEPIALQVDSARMHNDGHKFYLSDNSVWLTESVPANYLLIK